MGGRAGGRAGGRTPSGKGAVGGIEGDGVDWEHEVLAALALAVTLEGVLTGLAGMGGQGRGQCVWAVCVGSVCVCVCGWVGVWGGGGGGGVEQAGSVRVGCALA